MDAYCVISVLAWRNGAFLGLFCGMFGTRLPSNADRLFVACFEPMAMRWRKPPSKLAGLGEHVISKRYGKRKSAKVVLLTGDWRDTPAEGTVPLVPLFVAL